MCTLKVGRISARGGTDDEPLGVESMVTLDDGRSQPAGWLAGTTGAGAGGEVDLPRDFFTEYEESLDGEHDLIEEPLLEERLVEELLVLFRLRRLSSESELESSQFRGFLMNFTESSLVLVIAAVEDPDGDFFFSSSKTSVLCTRSSPSLSERYKSSLGEVLARGEGAVLVSDGARLEAAGTGWLSSTSESTNLVDFLAFFFRDLVTLPGAAE